MTYEENFRKGLRKGRQKGAIMTTCTFVVAFILGVTFAKQEFTLTLKKNRLDK